MFFRQSSASEDGGGSGGVEVQDEGDGNRYCRSTQVAARENDPVSMNTVMKTCLHLHDHRHSFQKENHGYHDSQMNKIRAAMKMVKTFSCLRTYSAVPRHTHTRCIHTQNVFSLSLFPSLSLSLCISALLKTLPMKI